MRLLTFTCVALLLTTALQAQPLRPTPRPDHLVADVVRPVCNATSLECLDSAAR